MGPTAALTHIHTDRGARVLTAGILTAALLALFAGTALAQAYPPDPEIIVVTPNATITITGSNWGPGTTVEVTYHNGGAASVSSASVNPDGTFSAEVTLPADAAPGVTALNVTGTGADGQPRQDTEAIFVASAEDAPAGDATDGTVAGPGTGGSAAASDAAAVATTDGGTTQAATDLVPTSALGAVTDNPASILLAFGLLAGGLVALVAARRRASR